MADYKGICTFDTRIVCSAMKRKCLCVRSYDSAFVKKKNYKIIFNQV